MSDNEDVGLRWRSGKDHVTGGGCRTGEVVMTFMTSGTAEAEDIMNDRYRTHTWSDVVVIVCKMRRTGCVTEMLVTRLGGQSVNG